MNSFLVYIFFLMKKEILTHILIDKARPMYWLFTVKEIATLIFKWKVYVKVNSVSQSGMSRRMSFYVVRKWRIQNITQEIAILSNQTYIDRELRVGGCGMDMRFHVLYTAIAYYKRYVTSQGKKTSMASNTWKQMFNTL